MFPLCLNVLINTSYLLFTLSLSQNCTFACKHYFPFYYRAFYSRSEPENILNDSTA